MIPGRATPEGTGRYASRYGATRGAGPFRDAFSLLLSPVGLGTYLGESDDASDRRYEGAIRRALALGCNVFDTAINYRCQRSERVLGRTLAAAFAEGAVRRDEVVVATKGGYLPFDGTPPRNVPAFFRLTYLDSGLLKPRDLVSGCHSIAPRYLENQIERSRRNLGLETLDFYYLHNPEQQFDELESSGFLGRMREAFTLLESKVASGAIGWYGTATWNGYRRSPTAKDYLSLAELVRVAREVGGEDHHFRVLQLPFNLAMTEALTLDNQEVGGARLAPLEAARRLGFAVATSGSLMQGRLARGLPEDLAADLGDYDSDAQRALDFARSAPGVTVALVGMESVRHVEENLGIVRRAPLAPDRVREIARSLGGSRG